MCLFKRQREKEKEKREERERETESGIAHLMIHSPDVHKDGAGSRVKAGA